MLVNRTRHIFICDRVPERGVRRMSRVSAKQKFAYLAAVVRRITFYFTLHSAFEEVTGSLDS